MMIHNKVEITVQRTQVFAGFSIHDSTYNIVPLLKKRNKYFKKIYNFGFISFLVAYQP